MKAHGVIQYLLFGCIATLLSACGQGSNEKKPAMAVAAVEPAKPSFFASTQEKCETAFRHMAYLAVMENAPMNASPERVQYEIEKAVASPVLREEVRKCVDFDYPASLKKNFECMHVSKTKSQLNECTNRYRDEEISWEAANKAKLVQWERESKKRLWDVR